MALANAPIVHAAVAVGQAAARHGAASTGSNDVFEQEPEQGARPLAPAARCRALEGRDRAPERGLPLRRPRVAADPRGHHASTCRPGKTVAIVGPQRLGQDDARSSAWPGCWSRPTGTILYDGVDLKTLNYRDLRRQIGFVLQENHLFDDTIARNIAFGDEEPDMDRVMWAARVANAHEFIERLPLGYDTRVGEIGPRRSPAGSASASPSPAPSTTGRRS